MPVADASSTPSRKKFLLGAVVLVGVVLTAVLVPVSKQWRDKASSSTAATPNPDITHDYNNVINALLDGNKASVDTTTVTTTPLPAATNTNTTPLTATPLAPLEDVVSEAEGAAAADKVATGPLGRVMSRGWGALGGAPATICYPADGKEVVKMVSDAKCTVIVLTKGGRQPYDITQQMNVSTTKIIIGNPIDMPKLNATGKTINRLFEVLPGGRLDIRAVRLYRSPPLKLQGGSLRIWMGGTVRVLLGGSFTATACIFLLQPQTVQSFMNEIDSTYLADRNRLLGGHILVLGGNVQLIGSQAFRWQPYGNPVMNVIQIGREMCVIAGNALAVGYFDAVGTAFLSAVNVGNLIAVMGGTAVLVGAGNINAAVANNQLGAGKNIFVGGGVMITVGYQNIGSFMCLLRSGFATQTVGAGVLVHIGHIHVRAWGVSAVFNAGQTHGVGAGIFEKLGGDLSTANINYVFAGAGANTFVGSGELYWLGAPQTRTLLTNSQHGVGGTYYNGAGYVNIIGCPSVSINMVRSQFLLGGEVFLGAGIVNYIQFKRFNAQLVNAFFGLGSSTFVGAGGVNVVNSFNLNRRLIAYSAPNASTAGAVWVGGRAVGAAAVNRNNQFITKKAINVRAPNTQYNKTQELIWKLLGRPPAPTPKPPKGTKGRKTFVAMKELYARQKADHERRMQSLASQEEWDATANSVLAINSNFEDSNTNMFDPADFKVFAGTGAGSGMNKIAADFRENMVKFMAAKLPEAIGAVEPVTNIGSVSLPANADCFLCSLKPGLSADHISTNTDRPNGVGTCRTSDACDMPKGSTITQAMASASAASSPLPLPDTASTVSTLAAGGADAALGGQGLPDTNLLWHEINIYCPGAETSGSTCITDDLLKQAIKAYFDPLSGYAAAVANTNVHPSVEEVVDDDLRAELSAPANDDQACMSGTKYNVYFTTHDNDQVPILNAVWDDISGDPSDFLAFLQEVQNTDTTTLAPAGVVCGMTIKRVSTASYPSAERMPAFQPTKGMSLLGPSVMVGDGVSIAPIVEVVKGQEYSMFVQNFPATSPVEVRLIHGLDQTGPVVASLDSFAPGDSGVSEVKWSAPADAVVDEGRYYLKASAKNLPALFSNSQPFHVTAKAIGRRV